MTSGEAGAEVLQAPGALQGRMQLGGCARDAQDAPRERGEATPADPAVGEPAQGSGSSQHRAEGPTLAGPACDSG